MVARRPVERTGRALIWTVVAFGVGTIIFGISRNFYLSLAVYMLIGAADMVSVVMRSTTIQLATPDELRGRVSAVNQVFIQSSNQVNTLYSGLVASFTSATFAVVSGGFGTLATVGLIGWRLPALYAYRVPRPAVSRVDVDTDEAEAVADITPAAEGADSEAGRNGDEPKAPSKTGETQASIQ
jgi:MFS family permease